MPSYDGHYATLAGIRSKGITPDLAQDAACGAAIAQAERLIEGWTGRWFYRIPGMDLVLDGGKKYTRLASFNATTYELQIPVPIITLTAVEVNGIARTIGDFIAYKRVGAPYDDRKNPRIVSKFKIWPTEGLQNIKLTGDFGFVEDLSSYTTPLPIVTAATKLAIRILDPKKMYGSEGEDREFDLIRSRIQEEEIPGYRYALSDPSPGYEQCVYSGDTEIDAIIDEYAYKLMTTAVE